jgi:hypothetical protein
MKSVSGENEVRTAGQAVSRSEHFVQFYSKDEELLDALTSFIGGGLNTGESAIVIATPEHLRGLRQRLEQASVDLMRAMLEDRYIPLDASVALTSFMVNGWPDDQLFAEFTANILRRASIQNRRVRAFGEMMALLWEQGLKAATVHLESLWNQACERHTFSLLCAYPADVFTGDDSQELYDICTLHAKSFLSRPDLRGNFLHPDKREGASQRRDQR